MEEAGLASRKMKLRLIAPPAMQEGAWLQGSLDRLMELANVLGLLYREEETDLDSEIEALIEKRAQARKNRDWATADAIRDELRARHVVLEDTPQGVKWHIEKE